MLIDKISYRYLPFFVLFHQQALGRQQ